MPSEADTCRRYVVPLLHAAGWDNDPHSIAEQRTITDGRIVPVGKSFIRKPPKRVDYLLRYRRDFPLAVVEAKAAYKRAADGLQQAKQYAEMLGLKFAFATNGREIIGVDSSSGLEEPGGESPTPDQLGQRERLRAGEPGIGCPSAWLQYYTAIVYTPPRRSDAMWLLGLVPLAQVASKLVELLCYAVNEETDTESAKRSSYER